MLHVVLRALCEVMAETVEPNHVHQRPSFPRDILSSQPAPARDGVPTPQAPRPALAISIWVVAATRATATVTHIHNGRASHGPGVHHKFGIA